MNNNVLLDTSFLIRLLNDEDDFHKNALDYYKYFLEKNVKLKVSTISIAEYCVRGNITDLPYKNVQILPFNFDHANKTGEFARILFGYKAKLKPRTCIPNDAKLFAQAHTDSGIIYFISSDTNAIKSINLLKKHTQLNFEFIDLHTPYNEIFGVLDL